MTKAVPCGTREARFRLEEARSHLDQARSAARVKSGSAWPNVAASSAVLAGIAAADAICCARSGRRSAGDSHDDAVLLLRGALPKDRQSVATTLGRLLSVKTPAQYGGKPLAVSKAATAIKHASHIVEAGESLIG